MLLYTTISNGARGRTRTGTGLPPRDFKSLVSAIPPPGHIVEAAPRFELGSRGFADLCLTTWLCRRLDKLERRTRFELATLALARRCSTAELHPHIHGASGQNRTADTRIFSPLLYRLSYRGMLDFGHLTFDIKTLTKSLWSSV